MPSLTTAPYVSAEDILVAARAISNDANQTIAGSILADNQPYIFPLLELAYEDLQDRLIKAGVNTYNETAEVLALTPYAGTDQTVDVELLYTGYFDGQTNFDSPQLPADMLIPLEIWERQSGTNAAWCLMTQVADALSSHSPTSYFRVWNWEQDILTLPGATVSLDLKFKYILLAPQLTDPTSPVLVARCTVALANLLVASVVKMRGGDPAQFKADAEMAVQNIISRYSRKDAYAQYNRIPFRGQRRCGGR